MKEDVFLMKQIIAIFLTLSLLCTIGAAYAERPAGGRGGQGGNDGMRGGNGGGTDKSGDTALLRPFPPATGMYSPLVCWGFFILKLPCLSMYSYPLIIFSLQKKF